MKLYRAFATVGGLTMVSRVFGFLRDILIAATLGSGAVADAFFVAFRFPNLFRRLFGEGAFNSAFVPLFAKRLEGEGKEAARAFAEEAMAGLVFVILALTILAEIAMPFLMYGLAPGFSANPEKFDLAVLLTRITMPYLLCMSLVALLSGMLNSVGKFVESSAVSIVLNLTMMAATFVALGLGLRNEPLAGVVQAWGVFAAGVLQLWLLVDGVRRNDLRIRLTMAAHDGGRAPPDQARHPRHHCRRRHPAQHRHRHRHRLAAGRRRLAPLLRRPRLRAAAGHRRHRHRRRAAARRVAPSARRQPRRRHGQPEPQPRVRHAAHGAGGGGARHRADRDRHGLFERGAFTAADTPATAYALAIFALGLPSFVLIKVFSPAYFAREDTATPMRYAAISLTANTLGSIALFFLFRAMGLMPHLGIAVATTLGGWLNAGLLYGTLVKRGEFVGDARLRRALPRIAVATIVMGAALWIAAAALEPWFAPPSGTAVRFGALAALVSTGLFVYVIAILALGVFDRRQLRGLLRRNPSTGPA